MKKTLILSFLMFGLASPVFAATTLSAEISANPMTGSAPLNGVDLIAAVTGGDATGLVTYRFDCTGDGFWDRTETSNNASYTAVDLCNYPGAGNYTASVRVDRENLSFEGKVAIVVSGATPTGTPGLNITKTARNLSDNTAFQEVLAADPSELIEYKIIVTSTGSVAADNVIVKDTLPEKMTYYGQLKIDGLASSGDIAAGINLGSLTPGQVKTITFQAQVAPTTSFAIGTTEMINTVLIYNTTIARTQTAKVQVAKGAILGATTVSTGLFDNFKLALLLSIVSTIFLSYFLLLKFFLANRIYVWGVDKMAFSAQEKIQRVLPKESSERAQERLKKIAALMRQRENY